MIHIDMEKLGKLDQIRHQSNSRGEGWGFVHVCVNDASRVPFTQIKPDDRKRNAVTFLGVSVDRVMTDNRSCYRTSSPATVADGSASITSAPSPSTPKTNRKDERFSSAPKNCPSSSTAQLPSSPCRHRLQDIRQETRPHRGQPVGPPQQAFGADHV
jgi:hypothetical protein